MIAVLDMGSNSFILLVVSEKGKTVLEEVYEVGIASGNLEKAKEVFKECVEKAEKMGRNFTYLERHFSEGIPTSSNR